jgi:lipopolysaccharide/colanic/teichoic acid biosynthesis glycosyltransferase
MYEKLKRIFDFVAAGLLCLFLSPILLLIAVAVKISSPGPVFHKWPVVGRGGRKFVGFKFRSMYQNADQLKRELLAHNEMTGPVFKLENDPRITRLGRFLRKYSLDELPQLWSVVKGDMSLVGPRPPLQSEYIQFNDWQKKKLAIKPGITCLWQTRGRNEISDFDQWVKLDLEYIQQRNFLLDMKILWDTAKVILRGTGK